jgi:hypothetical protein
LIMEEFVGNHGTVDAGLGVLIVFIIMPIVALVTKLFEKLRSKNS